MKRRFMYLYHRFMDYSIRKKLYIMNISIILIMTVLLGLTGYLFVKNLLTKKSQTSSISVVEQLGENYDSAITTITDFVFRQYFDSELVSFLSNGKATRKEKYEMNKFFSSFSYNLMNYNSNIKLVVISNLKEALYYAADSRLAVKEQDITGSIPYEKTLGRWGKTELYSCGNQVVLASRAIIDKNSMNKVGIITIGIDAEYLKELYKNALTEEANTLILFNDDNQIMLSSDETKREAAELTVKYYQPSVQGQRRFYYHDTPYIYVTWFSKDNNLWLMELIDLDVISKESGKILKPFIYIAILASALSGLIAWGISRGIAGTIGQLLHKIQMIGRGDFTTEIIPASKDEIGVLALKFNEMSKQIQNLIEIVSEEKTKMKSAEIKTLQFEYDALQAKINPHFLYNTLESINSMAKLNGEEQIADSIYLLGNYLRDTISNKRKYVYLWEEIENIQNYIKIQKVSCGDKIDILIHAEESLTDTLIPKLILQPLVENAFIHGVAPKVGKGYIWVNAVCEGTDMLLVVKDDGMGIVSGKMKDGLLMETDDRSPLHTKVGIMSVHKRIQILYGEKYGLKIKSEEGKGTSIIVRMPIRFEGEIEDEAL